MEARLAGGHRGDPNELSAVVELRFGETMIVLGSDLPALHASGAPLPAGWNAVLQRHPHLGAHHGLKIPHHGSPAAFHSELMTASGPGPALRPWWISPFNQGRRLPPADPDGVPRLVARNGEVSLTATPRRRDDQPVHAEPGEVPLAELPSLFAPSRPLSADAFSITPPAELGPLDAVWCGSFDDRGALRGAWRGERAFRVVR